MRRRRGPVQPRVLNGQLEAASAACGDSVNSLEGGFDPLPMNVSQADFR